MAETAALPRFLEAVRSTISCGLSFGVVAAQADRQVLREPVVPVVAERAGIAAQVERQRLAPVATQRLSRTLFPARSVAAAEAAAPVRMLAVAAVRLPYGLAGMEARLTPAMQAAAAAAQVVPAREAQGARPAALVIRRLPVLLAAAAVVALL
jgi:hypothetical protein